ncbi:RNA polymerase sigma factor [Rugamonas apoptosis]|uniref:RNA polymerase sigma factor n=1 Tax=Rugamonas apoptosis TaxID=2758570 RepID=A0A7W2IM30_9BURK|nr:RNA polymerase sigma factor [Rugamonas apoptosis]MBA5689042.1 RNA polymerase sigma factor [Rugamonas apoptosis]
MQPDLKPPPPGWSDAELAHRVAAGEREAFTVLMRRHNRSLYRAARSILRDDAEAEDALQDAYLLAFGAIGQYRADAKLGTWLTRIVVNEALARARRGRRRAEVIQLDGMAEPGEEQDMSNGERESPENAAMRAQMRLLLEQSIDQLPDAFRTVFVLRAVEEMSGEEVAACLGIPEATVRSRFFRARSLLRAALAQRVDVALEDAFAFDGERCDRIVAGVLARL